MIFHCNSVLLNFIDMPTSVIPSIVLPNVFKSCVCVCVHKPFQSHCFPVRIHMHKLIFNHISVKSNYSIDFISSKCDTCQTIKCARRLKIMTSNQMAWIEKNWFDAIIIVIIICGYWTLKQKSIVTFKMGCSMNLDRHSKKLQFRYAQKKCTVSNKKGNP